MFQMMISFLLILLISCTVLATDIKRIPARNAYQLVQHRNPKTSVLIDGRSSQMFADAHIKGAINIDAFQSGVDLKLKRYLGKEQIIVYCTTQKRSKLLIENLKKIKFNGEIIFITDGITGWNSAGHEVTANGSP